MPTYTIDGAYAKLKSECGCTDKMQTQDVVYSGPNLPSSGILTCNSMDVALQKIDAVLQELTVALYNLTTTTTAAP